MGAVYGDTGTKHQRKYGGHAPYARQRPLRHFVDLDAGCSVEIRHKATTMARREAIAHAGAGVTAVQDCPSQARAAGRIFATR